jgi:Domain of unknown function DUF11
VSGTIPATDKNFRYSVTATNSQGTATAGPFTVNTAPGAVLSAALACPKTVLAGKTGTCTLTISNEGPDAAAKTTGEVELPLSLAEKSCTKSCAVHQQTMEWSDGTLGVNKTATQSVTFTAKQAGFAPVLGAGASAVTDPSPDSSVALAEITVT